MIFIILASMIYAPTLALILAIGTQDLEEAGFGCVLAAIGAGLGTWLLLIGLQNYN